MSGSRSHTCCQVAEQADKMVVCKFASDKVSVLLTGSAKGYRLPSVSPHYQLMAGELISGVWGYYTFPLRCYVLQDSERIC